MAVGVLRNGALWRKHHTMRHLRQPWNPTGNPYVSLHRRRRTKVSPFSSSGFFYARPRNGTALLFFTSATPWAGSSNGFLAGPPRNRIILNAGWCGPQFALISPVMRKLFVSAAVFAILGMEAPLVEAAEHVAPMRFTIAGPSDSPHYILVRNRRALRARSVSPRPSALLRRVKTKIEPIM